MSAFHPLEVVSSDRETHIEVGEDVNYLRVGVKMKIFKFQHIGATSASNSHTII